jgi:hypothetical protein
MITENLQRAIDEAKDLPPEEQDRVAAAIHLLLKQPPVPSDAIRPYVTTAFEQVMSNSAAALDYLRDK